MPRWAKTHRLQPTYCHSAIASPPAIPDLIVIPLTACKVSFSVTSSARCSIWFDAQFVVDGMHDPLSGAEIPFRGLYGPVSKQELNLLKLATG
jgi:hypothetical protein